MYKIDILKQNAQELLNSLDNKKQLSYDEMRINSIDDAMVHLSINMCHDCADFENNPFNCNGCDIEKYADKWKEKYKNNDQNINLKNKAMSGITKELEEKLLKESSLIKTCNETFAGNPLTVPPSMPIKNGTYEAIDNEIKKLREKIEKLYQIRYNIIDEPKLKKCPRCNTLNYHYYADKNNWCCAFC